MKSLLTFPALALILSVSANAAAQDPAPPSSNCPPGSWFCADAQQPGQPPPLPSPEAPKPPPAAAQPPPAPPPPVVVYQPAPPIMVVQPRSDVPPRYEYTPREPTWLRQREWGLNLHLAGAMMGKKAAPDAGMGGLGFGLRFKPSPYFGIQGDVDFYSGKDFNGLTRSETAFGLNGMLFVNPRSKAQLYFLGGIGWSSARVIDDSRSYSNPAAHYSYFGGQIGVGLELRLAKHFALNGDVRGFVRGRTDNAAAYNPEFRDANGRSTNTSGGGLLTAGMTFYF